MEYSYELKKVGKEYHVISFDCDNNVVDVEIFKTKKSAEKRYNSRLDTIGKGFRWRKNKNE
jgi:hypothetical protein